MAYTDTTQKIVTLSAFLAIRNGLADTVCITTNGCFDVLHAGHVSYLEEASQQGRDKASVLAVLVNDDDSVRRLKGPTRPKNNAADRLRVLAALACVDYCILFPQDTPVDYLERIRPDIHVKSSQYAVEDLPERAVVEQHGGVVYLAAHRDGYSTTALLNE